MSSYQKLFFSAIFCLGIVAAPAWAEDEVETISEDAAYSTEYETAADSSGWDTEAAPAETVEDAPVYENVD